MERTVILPTGKRHTVDARTCAQGVADGLLRLDRQGIARLRKWVNAFPQPDGTLKFLRVPSRKAEVSVAIASQLDGIPSRSEGVTCLNCFEDFPDDKCRLIEGRYVCKACVSELYYPADYLTQKLLATPVGVDKEVMRAIYAECRRISAETGIPHAVDHVVPLRHRLVCGLNIPINLQIIPASENSRKSNFFDAHRIVAAEG